MADAIPVNSGPKKVAVKPAQVDENGVPVNGDYVAKVRDNLGSPSDFVSDRKGVEMTSLMDLPNGTQHKHTYIREDH